MNEPDFHLLNNTLLISAVLFAIGAMGVIARRNRVTLAVSFGILIQAGLIAAIGFSDFHQDSSGRLLWVYVFAAAIVFSSVAAGIAFIAESASRQRIPADAAPADSASAAGALSPPEGGEHV